MNVSMNKRLKKIWGIEYILQVNEEKTYAKKKKPPRKYGIGDEFDDEYFGKAFIVAYAPRAPWGRFYWEYTLKWEDDVRYSLFPEDDLVLLTRVSGEDLEAEKTVVLLTAPLRF